MNFLKTLAGKVKKDERKEPSSAIPVPNTKQISRIRKAVYEDWLEVLGRDLFILCVEKLDNFSLVTCVQVCKQWKEVATLNLIWQPRLERDFSAIVIKFNTPSNAFKDYGVNFIEEKIRKEEEEERKKWEKQRREMARKVRPADYNVCRMFHPSNGRNNFAPFTPNVLFEHLPPRDVLIKMLTRDNELRLSKEIQDEYWISKYPSLVTLKVQTQAVKEYGYENPWIVPSAISYYKDDPELMSIPHYVKFNRSQPGKIQVGESIPDLPLTTMQGCGTSLLQQLAPYSPFPVVVVAGSYT
jgi:hypothetical protein